MSKKALIIAALCACLAPAAQAKTVSVINGHHDIVEHRSGGLKPLGYTTNVFKHQVRGWNAALAADDPIVVEQQGVRHANTTDIQNYLSLGGRIILLGDNGDMTLDFYNDVFGTAISIDAPQEATTWSKTDAALGTTFEDDAEILGFASSVFPTKSNLAAGSTVFYTGDTGAQVFRSTYGAGDLFYIGWDYCCGGTRETYANYYEVLESAINFDRQAGSSNDAVPAPVPLPASFPFLMAALIGFGLVYSRKPKES